MRAEGYINRSDSLDEAYCYIRCMFRGLSVFVGHIGEPKTDESIEMSLGGRFV